MREFVSFGSPLYLQGGARSEKELFWKPRIGIREGKDRLWRAYLKDNPFISAK
jgi:3-methyladenine DNA glycosylase Mpg